MSIILTTQFDVTSDGTSSVLDSLGRAVGLGGYGNAPNNDFGLTSDLKAVQNFARDLFNKVNGKLSTESFDPNFVGTGRQIVVGGNIAGGKVPPIEEASVRVVYNQTPNFSIIVKKRMFSSLQNMYNPELMDPAELWLTRATKRLIARKCSIMADYERLSKIAKLSEQGADPASVMLSMVSTFSNDSGDKNLFTSALKLEKAFRDNNPVNVTTYFIDQSIPVISDLGLGNGIFEITAVTNINTNLGLSGDGGASLEIEDPYHILFVTENDIEVAIQETALSNFVDIIDKTASSLLSNAQVADERLSKLRRANKKSQISFTVDIRGGGAYAVIDAIGFKITDQNINDIPENQSLSSDEIELFISSLDALSAYSAAMRKTILNAAGNINAMDIREDVEYTRRNMRMFYLGKSIIQPMDTVHIFVDSGTRRNGEGEDIKSKNTNLFSLEGAINVASDLLQDNAQIDDEVLLLEWQDRGQHLRFEEFKKLYTMQLSGNGNGIQVFSGLVSDVRDSFRDGNYKLNISCQTNMEWLKISRYNAEPAIDQTDGIIYDPLTPFDIETDKVTGLPTGKVTLSKTNQRIINDPSRRFFFDSGPKIGTQLKSMFGMAQDVQKLGTNSIPLFQHAPGLVYKWKEGIMTMTYNTRLINSIDGSEVNKEQLRRDVGLFTSNTAFDNMDSANIISVMVTGFPYNYSSFVQSAMNSGAYVPDKTLNSGRDYFHSILDIQRSINKAHGNFVPFKTLSTNPSDVARAINLQLRLTGKSSEISQLRTKIANLQDKAFYLDKNREGYYVQQIESQISTLQKQLEKAENSFDESVSESREAIGENIVRVAGDDVTFDLEQLSQNNIKTFGDRLVHRLLKRREDVIYGKDKNYLVISDEYDKDYDIQAFVQKLRQGGRNLFKSTWQTVHQLCSNVANILGFEFFADTQGNIMFRPPQYNRTPLSVLQAMLTLDKTTGVKLFPDFLKKIFETREQSLVQDIIVIEWKIKLDAALVGLATKEDIQKFIFRETSNDVVFISDAVDELKAASKSRAKEPYDKSKLYQNILIANSESALAGASKEGLFDAKAQSKLQKESFHTIDNSGNFINNREISENSARTAYDNARKALAKLTGSPMRTFEEYDNAKVGAKKNGNSNPRSDIARIISNIASLISERSKLLRTLEKVLEQSIQIGTITDGDFRLDSTLLTGEGVSTEVFGRLIEDDSKNTLGHLSGSRFIIRDENIISQTFTEKPPENTVVTVNGTDPIVGEKFAPNGSNVPIYLAYGVDFDMWRQYGFRGEKPYEIPFFWSAEVQCAPYAAMLLARQRKNIVTGEIEIIGNEYYQLGDVVYLQDRQLLFYVENISHKIQYGGTFTTNLKLTYGRPPGEYIPTPLDVIGKGLLTKSGVQNSYRVRRQNSEGIMYLGTIRFSDGKTSLSDGEYAKRNFEELKRIALNSKPELDPNDKVNSPRLYIVTFTTNNDHKSQMDAVVKWLTNPIDPATTPQGIDPGAIGAAAAAGTVGGAEGAAAATSLQFTTLHYLQIDKNLIKTQNIRQFMPPEEEFTSTELELLRRGLVANEKSLLLDKSLENIVEIRLRRPPAGGWTD